MSTPKPNDYHPHINLSDKIYLGMYDFKNDENKIRKIPKGLYQ